MKVYQMYSTLFSPININKVVIKNRIVYPSLGLLYSYDTKLNDRYYHFFSERAKGGAGIVTVGPVGVDYLGSGMMALSIADDCVIPDFKHLTKLIHVHDAKAWIQLFHAGAYAFPFCIDGKDPIAPSAVFSKYSKAMPREMTIDDIKEVQQAFVNAALRAKEAGFDGVEIIASAGYLITQFLSPLTNKRTDEYGGSFEARTRFPDEIIRMIRQAVGPDYPVTIRMAGNDFVPGSNTDLETPKIAQVYENAGVDAISVTGGWHQSKVPQLPMTLPRGAFAYLAMNIKQAVSVPVMASNRITDPDIAEKILLDGYADLINLGRVLIADPEWPSKALKGNANEIRPCVACSQGCTDQIFSGQPVFCIANPMAGFEKERSLYQTKNPKRVMIIGAGPTGLEAAVTAKKIGHHVAIFEKNNAIGGQLEIACVPPHKRELAEFIRYYQAMIHKYQIPIHLNTLVTQNVIQEYQPEYIINAEGAEPLIPNIEGKDDPSVMNAWHVLRNNPLLGKEVAVIGGGAVGLETAFYIAQKGTISPEILHFLLTHDAIPYDRINDLLFKGLSKVTVFEMLPKVGRDVGKSTRWILMDNLKRYGVSILTQAKVLSIKHGIVTFEKEDLIHTQQFSNVILASGSKSVSSIKKLIETMGIPSSSIGDCSVIGNLGDAIHSGFLHAYQIDIIFL